jgi:THO complex subunit 4
LQLRYDKAGRSNGIAFVTYENKDDAYEAVKQFDGANANGESHNYAKPSLPY